MFRKRWDELHDPKLAEIGLEKRLESSIKGKDSANVYVLFCFLVSVLLSCVLPKSVIIRGRS